MPWEEKLERGKRVSSNLTSTYFLFFFLSYTKQNCIIFFIFSISEERRISVNLFLERIFFAYSVGVHSLVMFCLLYLFMDVTCSHSGFWMTLKDLQKQLNTTLILSQMSTSNITDECPPRFTHIFVGWRSWELYMIIKEKVFFLEWHKGEARRFLRSLRFWFPFMLT